MTYLQQKDESCFNAVEIEDSYLGFAQIQHVSIR